MIVQEEPLEVAIRHLTRSIIQPLIVRKISVWRLNEDRAKLGLHDPFDSKNETHSQNLSQRCAAYPAYFPALDAGRVIDAADALSGCRDAGKIYY